MAQSDKDLKKLIKLSHEVLEKRIIALEKENVEIMDLVVIMSKKVLGDKFE